MSKVKSRTIGEKFPEIEAGDKVKINFDRIYADVNFERMNPKFKEWCEENKDKGEIFVAFPHNPSRCYKNTGIFELYNNDAQEIDWLFSINDLIKV